MPLCWFCLLSLGFDVIIDLSFMWLVFFFYKYGNMFCCSTLAVECFVWVFAVCYSYDNIYGLGKKEIKLSFIFMDLEKKRKLSLKNHEVSNLLGPCHQTHQWSQKLSLPSSSLTIKKWNKKVKENVGEEQEDC